MYNLDQTEGRDLPMELLYADDLVLTAEKKELLLEKVGNWKKGWKRRV